MCYGPELLDRLPGLLSPSGLLGQPAYYFFFFFLATGFLAAVLAIFILLTCSVGAYP